MISVRRAARGAFGGHFPGSMVTGYTSENAHDLEPPYGIEP